MLIEVQNSYMLQLVCNIVERLACVIRDCIGCRCNRFICTIFHRLTHLHMQTLTTFPYVLCIALLNGVLCNPGIYIDGYFICAYPLYALGNGGVSECYTGQQLYSTEHFSLVLCPCFLKSKRILVFKKMTRFSACQNHFETFEIDPINVQDTIKATVSL